MLQVSDVKGLGVAEESRVETLKVEAKAAKQPEADVVKAAYHKTEEERLIKSGMRGVLPVSSLRNLATAC